MASFARVALFDKRGTGLSDRVSVEEMADVESRLDDLAAVMDAAEMSRAALFATADGRSRRFCSPRTIPSGWTRW
jgi:pimeloyl-ACP methyl ester carboxylesterase